MTSGTIVRVAAALLVCLASAAPSASEAQLGRLKQLKNKVRPDSAAKADAATKDSVSLANGEVVDSTPATKSRLSRAVGAAKKASDKFEDVTGVSTKDAALAASGMGLGSIAAKKLGVDPAGIASRAISQASQQRAAASKAKSAAGAIGSAGDLAKLAGMLDPSALQAAPKTRGTSATAAGLGLPGIGEAEGRAMVAFQQEMMQVAMAASGGDAAAQARLEEWNAIAMRHQPEIEKLALVGQTGDMAAIQKMYRLQLDMMREWSRSSAVKKTTRATGATVKP